MAKANMMMLEHRPKNIMVVLRNFKQYYDLNKYLYQYFGQSPSVKGMLPFCDDRFRMHLGSAREHQRRMNAFLMQNLAFNNEIESGQRAPPKLKMNMSLIEMHLLYKLSLLMEQKHSHNYGTDSANSSKKRGLHQSGVDENDQNYISRFQSIESRIVDGAKVELKLIGAGTELELILDEVRPQHIIMMEAHLDFLRVIETYQARRLKSGAHNLKVDILLCDETAEKYLHMTSIEEEKRAFKALVEMKPKLVVDRRDTELS